MNSHDIHQHLLDHSPWIDPANTVDTVNRDHLSNISRGVLDSRNLVYFGSMVWLFLALTLRILDMRKWR